MRSRAGRAAPREVIGRRPALQRARCEPVEIESSANTALDRIEADVQTVLALGGEAALRARLDRLLGRAGVEVIQQAEDCRAGGI